MTFKFTPNGNTSSNETDRRRSDRDPLPVGLDLIAIGNETRLAVLLAIAARSCSAAEAARRCGIPRNRARRAVDHLIKRGLIRAREGEDPPRYTLTDRIRIWHIGQRSRIDITASDGDYLCYQWERS